MIPLRGTPSMLPGFLGSSSSHRRRFSLQRAASSKAWLRLLRLAGGAADPRSSPTGSLVAKHYWDPTDLNKFSSWFRFSWSPSKVSSCCVCISIPLPYSAHLKASVTLPLFSAPFFLLPSRLPLSACLTSSPPFLIVSRHISAFVAKVQLELFWTQRARIHTDTHTLEGIRITTIGSHHSSDGLPIITSVTLWKGTEIPLCVRL